MDEKNALTAKHLAVDGIMAALLFVVGLFKIPSFIPGAEFQLSAPFAVAIAKSRGFKRYLLIGIAASIVGFFLGMQNVFNITIAMVYRIVAGSILTVFKNSRAALVVSGPCGTFVSRIVLGTMLGTNVWVLVLYAVPGMVFTAVTAPIITKLVEKLLGQQLCYGSMAR